MKILGIETSCDETAAAVVEDGTRVLSSVIASSADLHSQTGGVVPEVAAREHLRSILPVVEKALRDAGVDWPQIDAIAVTYTPGLIASLLVGVNTSQALAYLKGKPLIPTHHIAGHIYANFLGRSKEEIQFPLLVLTVSGGHNELILMKGHHDFRLIGQTLDDAAGEAFDKVARLLGLGFPGGPAISRCAEQGNDRAFDFPQAMLGLGHRFDFSFSGLKSAVRRAVEGMEKPLSPAQVSDLSASFQRAVAQALAEKLADAATEHRASSVHLAGGVSANRLLRQMARQSLPDSVSLFFPKEMVYCTDNAAMIAGAAYFDPRPLAGWKGLPASSWADLAAA